MVHRLLIGLLMLVPLLPGCNRTPSVAAPKFNAKGIAEKAVELCDQDGDGVLTATELSTCPGLWEGMRTIDQNGDGKMTAEEIEQRMRALIESKNACQIVECQISRRGQPIADAEITFTPEPFMSDAIVSATGTTGPDGRAEINCPATPFGVQPGFYRVSISKPDGSRETLPEKYNQATTLGTEVSGLSLGNEIGVYIFKLD